MAYKVFHINFDNILKACSIFFVKYLPKIVKPTNVVCKECVMAKQRKAHFLARSLL